MSRIGHTPPLAAYRCFETFDVCEAQEIVAQNFCSHRLERLSASDRFDACQNRAQGRRVSLNYIRYGADVVIDPGELTHFYLIQIPISGTAAVKNGCKAVNSTPHVGTVLNPDRHTSMRWHEGCEKVLLQIDKDYMREIACRTSGMDANTVRFAPDLNLQDPGIAAWARTLRSLFGAADDGKAFPHANDTCQRHLEEVLVTSLLEVQQNTVTPLLRKKYRGTAPAVLKRALAMIHERFEDNMSLLDICDYARVSPRNLQMIFKRELGCSPIEKLHEVRLDYARYLLLSQGGNTTVAEVADRSGHRHAGRFSLTYKARFGESPRDTLRTWPFG